MNNTINIAEILKDYPKGTKLYSPLFGNVTLEEVDSTGAATVKIMYKLNSFATFFKTGLYYNYEGAECLLFPSSKMRDWSKFFKRGDVVRSVDDRTLAVFKGWENNDYTSFYASIVHHAKVDKWDEDIVLAVKSFYKEPEEFVRGFIADAEEHYNGKYNPETLQVESIKSERPFKPFDKVLVRDDSDGIWYPAYFAYYKYGTSYPYACMDSSYRYCIHYEGNEHLLGATDPYKRKDNE